MIRRAKPQDGPAKHDAHMRSIREVCAKDYTPAEIAGWGNRSYNQERWLSSLASKENAIWVLELEGKIEGYAHLEIRMIEGVRSAHFYGLYLTPTAVGKGFGKQLALAMIELARDSEAESISLESTLTAHDFYRSLGFEDDGPLISPEIGGAPVRCQPMRLDLEIGT